MFGQSKPVLFEPYGRRRSRWRLPPWLVLLLLGIAIGAGGVIYVQEKHLPPRLSADDTARLRAAFEQADAERTKLRSDLADTRKQLDAALADKKSLTDEVSGSRAVTDRLRDDIASAVAGLPPDPRGGVVEVRAGRFTVKGGTLAYDVVLSRDKPGSKPLGGVMQIAVTGESGHGSAATTNLKPVAVAVGAHEILRGSLPMPEGFKPRQATVSVLDRPEGKLLGMRVMYVK